MIRIAVTGAGGFCGSHVATAAAASGADVVCVGRRPGPVGRHVPWEASADVPDLGGADVVVHCAAAVGDPVPGSPAEASMRAVNVDGTARLLRAAAGRPVVWVSSASVYAPGPKGGRVREDHPVGGHLNAYGRTKAEGEALALAAGAVVLRPRAVYGTGDPHLVPRLLAGVRAGLLLLPGPDTELSLTAVENLAYACLAAAGWPPGAYNIADPAPYRRDDAVRAVLHAHGVRARIRHLPVPVAVAAATAAQALTRLRPHSGPALTRYAVDQLAHGVVLDVGKAESRGWTARRGLADHLSAVRNSGT
ncbi:NAD-dependent epimerase/dehydratase family protein [Streptomyces sp. SCUT-3]|uniref:NAD-dependent epimerase/dehydratase family protein n=1 Tax=Streptomyces sp. SCUT-3 TaxID=2684469 RepID=UPI0015F89BAF|nr:NAD(P)-dependent oxidoreductase [Streptomyces sp. SCUT-3]QMV20517.1 NAD-dependent epimerase/dehydratase family protein [Streptomyces sp. SCUT-3]